MERYALQLKISLNGIKPLIWRRVVVNADIGLFELNDIIQTVMQWDNSHLHRFYDKNQVYMMPEETNEMLFPDEVEAYEEALLEDVLTKEGQKLKYEYDFGDSWIHDIVVEKILPPIDGHRDAIYIKGKNATPPEDCGGNFGYEHLLEVMRNPKHPEYEDMTEWLGLEEGESYDPTDIGCSVEEINDILAGNTVLFSGDMSEVFQKMQILFGSSKG